MKSTRAKSVLLVILSWAFSVHTALAAVIAPHSIVAGQSLAEWSAAWWQWALAIPTEQNPQLDETGANAALGNLSGPVVFLAGTFGGSVERAFSITAGKYLFLPVLNTVFIATDPSETLQTGLDANSAFIQSVTALNASIDGVPVAGLFSHREITLAGFGLNFPDDNNLLGLPAGSYGPAASDGYWLMLEPLAPGNHVIAFGGEGVFGGDPFSVQVLDRIAVREPSILALLCVTWLGTKRLRLRPKKHYT